MATDINNERALFEAKYGPKDSFAWRNPDDTYKVIALQMAWEIWQAARSAISADAVPAQASAPEVTACVACGEAEPGTWMCCKSANPRALCNAAAQVPAQGVPSERDDAERLRFAMQDIDGFGDISMDKYDYAILEAEANGRDEPNADDELNGIRQLCDAAILATNSQTQEK